jgi:hypothetical protein
MDYQSLFGFVLVVLVTIVFVYLILPRSQAQATCPIVHRYEDGSFRVGDQYFPERRSFEKWWAATGCGAPVIVERREEEENLYARTPINKVDDYEFSRIFGYQAGNRMIVPEQNFDLILNQRRFDWPDQPLLADERSDKYRDLPPGVTEEFMDGRNGSNLKEIVLSEPTAQELAVEAVSRYGERRRRHRDQRVEEIETAESCKLSREDREVAAMVAATYTDPNFEPVVTRVGPHNWEVSELKQLRAPSHEEAPRKNLYAKDAVDIRFKYRQAADAEEAIDPYFPVDHMPYGSNERDRFYGPVPGMERMFGPTFDTQHWY